MKQIITSSQAHQKHRELLNEVALQLKEFTNGKVVDFGEHGFEDMAGQDICGMDSERVYFTNDFEEENSYSLHDLDLLDAIKILGDFEANIYNK